MKKLRIKNIKSFKDSGDLNIKPLTVFVGRNSCGKSSLLRFPVVLAQTRNTNTDSPLTFYGNMLDYGNYEDVIHSGCNDGMEFEIHYDIDINDTQDYRYIMVGEEVNNRENTNSDIRDVSLKIVIDKENKRTFVKSVQLFIDDNCLTGFFEKDGHYIISLSKLRVNEQLISADYEFQLKELFFDDFFPLYEERELFPSIVDSVRKKNNSNENCSSQDLYNKLFVNASPYGDDSLTPEEDEIKTIKKSLDYASTIMSHVYNRLDFESKILTYIGPFRANPERTYRDSERRSINVGVKGENTSTVLIRDYQNDKRLIDKISEWLHNTMNYRLSINEIGSSLYQIVLEDDKGNISNIIDVGYGVSQVLPIITQVIRSAYVTKKSLKNSSMENDEMILIEQPELHLHPAAQADLADLFVDCIKKKSNKKIIIETHSEHIIRKLQVLIADKNNSFTNKDICIYYVDKDQNGVATVEEMRLLENGKFEKPWPSGFFDKAHQLSMELLRNSSIG